MPVTSPSRPERLRLGLTWRVVTLTSLLLVALAVLFTYLSHTNLTRQFTATRQEQIERQQRELEFAIRRSEKGLQQLAGLIAASPDLGPALEQGAPPSPPEALSRTSRHQGAIRSPSSGAISHTSAARLTAIS